MTHNEKYHECDLRVMGVKHRIYMHLISQDTKKAFEFV
jgi:hypothetical protein